MAVHCETTRCTGLGPIRWLLAIAIMEFALTAAAGAAAQARDLQANDNQFPYSIMAPEPGTAAHRRAKAARSAPQHPSAREQEKHPSLLGHERFVSKLHGGHKTFAARGSPGVVLPTPLPRTQLIPPEGHGGVTLPPMPQEQGPSIVPGLAHPVPNLAHGPETFQDRASRCAFQSGLYNVPGGVRSRYIGGCVQ